MSGWIKLHRDLVKHWIYSFDEPDKALAWIDLIMMARHEAGEILLKGRVQRVSRGQVAMSQMALQKRWRWSQNKVKRFLKLLKNERMVDFQANDLTTLISICKYEEYQERERPDERPLGRPDGRPVERATDDQTDDDIRMKEGKEGKNKPPLPPLQQENQTKKCAPRFAEFWTAYPTKVGKKKCSEIWKRRNLDTIADLIVADVTRRRIDDVKWTEGYIPNPQTYLNGDRWEDDIQTKKVNGNETHKRINQGIDHTDTSWAETYNREYGRGSS